MPRISRVPSLALALAALVGFAAPAASDPWLLAPGDHYSSVGGSFFSSDSYHDFNGTRHSLWNGGLHEERSLYSYNEFGWTKGRTFILGFPYQGVTRRQGSPAADGGRTETGFGDLDLGLRFKIKDGPTAVSLEGDWNPPLGYNRNLSPRLGDGVSSVNGRLEIGAPVGGVGFLELEGGYRAWIAKVKPTNQTLFNALLGFWWGHSLLIGGRYEGSFGQASRDTNYQALIERTPQGATWPTSDAVPGTTTDRVSTQLAGPMLVYRVDDHLDLVAGSMHTASAKNALHVDRFYVAVSVKQTKLGRLQGLAGGAGSP